MAMLERGRRSTCGTRMTELVGEAAEMDKAFWGSAVWAEGEDDSENDSFDENEEEVKPDTFDSDFNDTETEESDEDEDGQLQAQQRRERVAAARSGGGYKEPTKPPAPRAKPHRPAEKINKNNNNNVNASTSGRVTLRQSTQSKSSARAQELLTIKAPVRVHRPPIPKKEYSQKDLLMEALDTEVVNFKWLRSQQMAEEERNRLESKSMKPTKKIARTFLSSQKGTTITFVEEAAWPGELFNSTLYTRRPSDRHTEALSGDEDEDESEGGRQCKQALLVCAVSGLPARYRDPLTGLPYHDAAAFKTIRENHPRSKQQLQSQRHGSTHSKYLAAPTYPNTMSGVGAAEVASVGSVGESALASKGRGKRLAGPAAKVPKKRGRKPKVAVSCVDDGSNTAALHH